jgi:hypothetical protein
MLLTYRIFIAAGSCEHSSSSSNSSKGWRKKNARFSTVNGNVNTIVISKKLLDGKNVMLNVPLLQSGEIADLHFPDYYPFQKHAFFLRHPVVVVTTTTTTITTAAAAAAAAAAANGLSHGGSGYFTCTQI